MISMSIRNAKINFSRILQMVERGEDVIIRNRQRPVAKLSSFNAGESKNDFSVFIDGLSEMRKSQKMAPRGHLGKIIRQDREGRD